MNFTRHSILAYFVSLSVLSATAYAAQPPKYVYAAQPPKYVYAPLTMDSKTLQQVVTVHQRSPLRDINLVLDLSGDFMWTTCTNYMSTTYQTVKCHTPLCTASGSAIFGCGSCQSIPSGTPCSSNTCLETLTNPATGTEVFNGELSSDTLALYAGEAKDNLAQVPDFAFSCAPSSLTNGLAKGVNGVAGMSWGRLALPFQLTVALEIDRKFGICLSGDAMKPGFVFFGAHPVTHYPPSLHRLNVTFLQTVRYPHDYFLKVSAITVNGKNLSIDAATLRLTFAGTRGSTMTTVFPYTRLASPIYKALVDAFTEEANAMGMKTVKAVKPFEACFASSSIKSSVTGPAVPVIDLVLDNEFVFWRIHGANSIVDVGNGVVCLAFLEADKFAGTAMVLGSHQLVDNLLYFDLVEFKLFFSSSLLQYNGRCSDIYKSITS